MLAIFTGSVMNLHSSIHYLCGVQVALVPSECNSGVIGMMCVRVQFRKEINFETAHCYVVHLMFRAL